MPKAPLVGSEWRLAAGGGVLPVFDPARGEPVAEIALAGTDEVGDAVVTARAAFDCGEWSRTAPAVRARALWRVADLIERHAEELALLESLDAGKPLAGTRRIDVPQAAAHFRYQAAAAIRLDGDTIPVSDTSVLNYTLNEPMGVVAAVTPWNFPLIIASRTVAPALAAGNSVILKPAEDTPLTALRLGQILLEAGVPAGVFNVLPGLGEGAGRQLAEHRDVDKVAFTGSQEAAREIVVASAGNFKRLGLELGGKSPAIVCEDVDLDVALPWLMIGAFANQGQNCCAATRILVDEKRYDEVREALVAATRRLKVGDMFESDTDLGPLISPSHRQRVEQYIAEAVADGARLLVGAERPGGSLKDGWFLTPAILERVETRSRFASEEVFGPSVALEPFSDLDRAVELANSTTYGLAAGVFTQRLDIAKTLARRLNAGTIWVNCYERFDAASPFGGMKQSGYGHGIGHLALTQFMEVKSVWLS